MGLDVYLSYYTNYHLSKASEEAYDKISENLWNEVREQEGDELSQKTKDRIWGILEKEAQKLGLDKYGADLTHHTRIEEDSNILNIILKLDTSGRHTTIVELKEF
jgi:hypothetical protein